MNQSYPVPPPELVRKWTSLANEEEGQEVWSSIATQAAQWGADQELEACCEWMRRMVGTFSAAAHLEAQRRSDKLRAARRPKPPSLKEQALLALGPEPLPETGPTGDTILNHGAIERHRFLRRALEALDD